MRDFRDAKAMARTLRQALAAKGLKISIAESLELVARQLGFADWNTLAAAIRRAPRGTPEPPPAESAPSAGAAPTPLAVHTRPAHFSERLEATLHRTVALARQREHTYATLEHLLLSMLDDQDAAAVLEACHMDLQGLRATLSHYVDEDLKPLIKPGSALSAPTAGFHRVVQRGVVHVQSSGRTEVTAANLLVALFSEQESHACIFLQAQGMARGDAVNFIAHGVRKGDQAA
jgi:hypothetical protein